MDDISREIARVSEQILREIEEETPERTSDSEEYTPPVLNPSAELAWTFGEERTDVPRRRVSATEAMSWRLSDGRRPPPIVSPTDALSWRLGDSSPGQRTEPSAPRGFDELGTQMASAPPVEDLSWTSAQPAHGPFELVRPRYQDSNSNVPSDWRYSPPTFPEALRPTAPSVMRDEGAPLPAYEEQRPETPPPSYEEAVGSGLVKNAPN